MIVTFPPPSLLPGIKTEDRDESPAARACYSVVALDMDQVRNTRGWHCCDQR
jgi:hypothetical protein